MITPWETTRASESVPDTIGQTYTGVVRVVCTVRPKTTQMELQLSDCDQPRCCLSGVKSDWYAVCVCAANKPRDNTSFVLEFESSARQGL